jgi:hypothetical protein
MVAISKIIPFFLMILILTAVPLEAANLSRESAALIATGKWLGLIDAGNYTESRDKAAESFRKAVTPEQWRQSLQTVREPLGKLFLRRVKTKTYTTSLPGLPDGEYVVIEFDTFFEYKQSAIETVTSVLERDGQWKVIGYSLN